MLGYEKAYRDVTALVAKGMGVSEAIKKSGHQQSQYYVGKKAAAKKMKSPRKASRKHTVIEAASTPSGQVTVIMGTPEQIKAVLG